MNSIQTFWFVASGVVESTAISPSPPASSAAESASALPIPSDEAWLTNTERPACATSESYVTTVTPFFCAAFSAGTSASLSLAAIIKTLYPP
ncbi:unannotated protein [freshwater metagenome]|uniref:Unannotated protein n=1 Tax=freshwater metagenome TaxID=449393 RepID=A0A6J7A3W7_9ZZZZ